MCSEVDGAQEEVAIVAERSRGVAVVVGTKVAKSISILNESTRFLLVHSFDHADNPKVRGEAVDAAWKVTHGHSFTARRTFKPG